MPVDTNKYRHSYYYSYYYYCKYYRPVYTLYVLIVVSAVCCNRSCVYMMTLCTCVWSDRHCVCVMLMCVCGLCVVWQALCLCDADVSCVALRTRVKWTLMVVQDHVVVLMDIKVLTVTGHLLSLSLSPCLPLCLSLCLSVSLSLSVFSLSISAKFTDLVIFYNLCTKRGKCKFKHDTSWDVRPLWMKIFDCFLDIYQQCLSPKCSSYNFVVVGYHILPVLHVLFSVTNPFLMGC